MILIMAFSYLLILVWPTKRHVALDETTAETQQQIGDFLNLLGIVGNLLIISNVETLP